TSNVLQIFYFINMIVKILCYVVPAILILMLSIDIFKIVMSGEDNVIKTNMRMIVKRIIFAVAIFFVPMIVNIAFGLLGDMQVSAADCYNNATPSKIEKIKSDEESEYKAYKAEKKEEKDTGIKKEKEEEKKKIKENAAKANATVGRTKIDPNASASEKIAQSAEILAWPKGTKKSITEKNYPRNKKFTSWSQLTKGHPTKGFQEAYDKVRPDHWDIFKLKWGNGPSLGASCDVFAGTVVRYSGYDTEMPFGVGSQRKRLASSKKWKKVSTAKRGDFCSAPYHSKIYLGNGLIAEAHYGGQSIGGREFGHIEKGSCKGKDFTIYRAVG
ncbi:MAG: hypothetical protein ACI31R_00505, partial [Bacilli bacterium]